MRSSGACRASTQLSDPACRSASARIAARSVSANQIGPRDDNDAGTPERSNRLAKEPARDRAAQARTARAHRARRHRDRVPADDAETHRRARSARLSSSSAAILRKRHPIGVLKMRNVGQVLFEDSSLVVHSPGVTVAATQNGDAELRAGETSVRSTRPLGSCPCRPGQVADRDNRHRRAVRSQPAPVEAEVAGGDRRAVKQRRPALSPPRASRGTSPLGCPRISRKYAFRSNRTQSPASIARMIALAISSVPTAVGSSRCGFMS